MNEPSVPPLRLSWSAIQSFLSCQRKYELTYREGLRRKPSAAHRNLLLGSAFHAGLEAALQFVFDGDWHQMVWTEEWLVTRAIEAAEAYLEENVVQGKMVRDGRGQLIQDDDYYAMCREIDQLVRLMLRFHIPMIGLGKRFSVPTIYDVLSGDAPTGRLGLNDTEPVPAIEWHFEFPISDGVILSGYVDTILWDIEEEEYVLVDWKTRSNFPYDNMAMIDGQLHLYAGVVNHLAEYVNGKSPLSRVMMYQMRTKLPSPASINAKTNLPNTGAKSYDTTWDYWVRTLPRGLNPEHYRKVLMGKLKEDSEYQRPIHAVVTDQSTQMALDNVQAAIDQIQAALASGRPLAAILSSNGCKWCDFAPLCINVLRYGGDATSIVNDLYDRREDEVVAEEQAAED